LDFGAKTDAIFLTDSDSELEMRFSSMDKNMVREIEVAQIAQTAKTLDAVLMPSRMSEFELTILSGSSPMFEKSIEKCLFETLESTSLSRAQLERLMTAKKFPIHEVEGELVLQYAPLVYVKTFIDQCLHNKLVDDDGGFITTRFKTVKAGKRRMGIGIV
jgi:hypothetical protein